MRRFFISSKRLAQAVPRLAGAEANHVKNVLRLKTGDRIRLFDDSGLEYRARIRDFTAEGVGLDLEEQWRAQTESPLELTVAQGFLKEKKMEELLRPLTELGVQGWLPFFAGRSVARPDGKRLAKRAARWQAIVKEAAKQCRRVRLPRIHPVTDFEGAIEAGAGADLAVFFWEGADTPLSCYDVPRDGRILLMLGPEGGFSDTEAARARAAGFVAAGLGPRILRAQTATIAAVTLAQALFGDMDKKNEKSA